MSTQTAHLGLHQWESTDSFLREDFNQDNRKIDQAVSTAQTTADAATNFIKLMDFTTQEEAQQIDLDVSQLNLPQYNRVFLRMENAITSAVSMQVRLNNIADRIYDRSGENSSSKSTSFFEWSVGSSGKLDGYLGGCSAELFFLGGIIGARIFGICGGVYENTERAYLNGSELFGISPRHLKPEELTSIQLIPSSSQGVSAGLKIQRIGVRV